ncbi:prolyl oligopeptidase family serine peptidase [Streptacidiphilus sp. PAMC 29251]
MTEPNADAAPTALPDPALPDPAPAGPDRAIAEALGITLATSVEPGDTSTSTVIRPTGAQIQLGTTPGVATHSDLVYATPLSATGEPVELRLDLQIPATEGAKPLVVYLPGGGFVMALKENGLDQRTYLAEQGYAVASVQYRTILNGATYRDAVADVKSAIRYLRAHADRYGIDPERVAVYGESAGGYLAAMTGTTNGREEFEVGEHLDRSSRVQAVVDKFGPSDLAQVGIDFDRAAEESDAVARSNPAGYADASTPPFLLLHGSADTLIPPDQTLLLHHALRAAGADSTRYLLLDANHGDLAFLGDTVSGLPWTTQQVMDDIVAFLGKHLGHTTLHQREA